MYDLFIFDIDGTLTPSRERMEKSFKTMFLSWILTRDVFLVTGSDYEKVCEQIPVSILKLVKGVFTCQGSEFWHDNANLYRNSVRFPDKLLKKLQNYAIKSQSPFKTGNFIEIRSGMINFSTLGQGASLQERNTYNQWDNKVGERKSLVQKLSKEFPDLEFHIGGHVSIDIAPKGLNKSQILPHIQRWFPEARMAFFGDKMENEGNDRPLKDALAKLNHDHESYSVQSPRETSFIMQCMEHDEKFIFHNQTPTSGMEIEL